MKTIIFVLSIAVIFLTACDVKDQGIVISQSDIISSVEVDSILQISQDTVTVFLHYNLPPDTSFVRLNY